MTLTGTLAILALAHYVWRHGIARSIIAPFPFVCVQYFFYFNTWVSDTSERLTVDLANLLSFVIFTVTFKNTETIASLRSVKRLFNTIWPSPRFRTQPTSLGPALLATLTIIPLLYAVSYTYEYSVAYGSIQRALVRFYVSSSLTDFPPWMDRFHKPIYSVALMCLFVLRLDCRLHQKQSSFFLSWIAAALIFATVFPTGTVGYEFSVFLIVLIADAIYSIRSAKPFRLRLDTAILLVTTVGAGALLLSIRSISFGSPTEVFDYLRDSFHDDSARAAVGGGREILPEKVAVCLDNYGGVHGFLWMYTPYSILVNPIPREFWERKPVGFGRILAVHDITDPYLGITELGSVSFAAGLAGEGYANGGYVGIVTLSILIGALCGYASSLASHGITSANYVHIMLGLLCRMVATGFVRGDMLSAWSAYVYPLLFAVALCFSISHFNVRRRTGPSLFPWVVRV